MMTELNIQAPNQKKMHVTELLENDMHIRKAGIIPYIRTEKGIEMMFAISSDPAYGGPDPMISKGHIDEGETPEQAAVREGNEELGLLPANFAEQPFLVKDETIRGMTSTYGMRIMAVEVKSKDNFGPFGYETAETIWMTGDEYAQRGRKSQLGFIQALLSKLSA